VADCGAKKGIAHEVINTNRAAIPRDAITGENPANLMCKILDLHPIPNLKPRPCHMERVNTKD
jgi:hypothetical protein